MRLTILKNYSWRIANLVVAAVLLLALAIFGSSETTKESNSTKDAISPIFQEENQVSETKSTKPGGTEESADSDNSQKTTSIKLHVLVNSNTTNGETTGQAEIEVTKNGETNTISENLDKLTDSNNFRIKVNDGEVDFDVDFDQNTKSKTSSETDVRERQRTRD